MFNFVAPGGEQVTCDDQIVLYPQYSTQWDALCHVGHLFDADGDGQAEKVFYNGYRAGEDVVERTADGGSRAFKLGIENLAVSGVQGRGVMVDLRRQFGTDLRSVGYDDLMRTIDAQEVEILAGDFVLLYSGFDRLLLSGDMDNFDLIQRCATLDGADTRLQRWIIDSGLVALCSDTVAVESLEHILSPEPPPVTLPLHELCLFKQGIHLGELWYLEELADWLASNGRSAFLLTAPPLRLPGCVGSPVTPVATV